MLKLIHVNVSTTKSKLTEMSAPYEYYLLPCNSLKPYCYLANNTIIGDEPDVGLRAVVY